MLDKVKEELELFKKRVIKEARTNLTRKGINSSNALYKSLKGESKVSKNSIELGFSMEEYGAYQDKGVKGKLSTYASASKSPFKFKNKMPPSKVFEKWIKQRGIKGRDNKGRFISNKTLTYLIARSIYRKGIKGSMFFTRPFELAYKKLPDEIIKAYGLDIDEFLKFTTNGK